MHIWLKKSETMAVNSKEAKKRLYAETLKELKNLMTTAGLLNDPPGGRVDRVWVLRQAVEALRSHPTLSSPSDPLDLSPSGTAEAPLPPLETAAPASSSEPAPHLSLGLALPHYTLTSVSAPASSPLEVLAKDLPPKSNFMSALIPTDGIVFTSSMLRLSTGSPPLQLFLRLRHIPVHVTATAAPDRLSVSLACNLLSSPFLRHPELQEVVFTTQHSPDLRLSRLDRLGLELLGRLPQDVLGSSLLNLIHRDDAQAIRETHQEVAGGARRTVSREVRFLLPSGGELVTETEWSAFLNPWNRRVELIAGRHRVRAPPPATPFSALDLPHPHQMSEAQIAALQTDIAHILSKPVKERTEAEASSGSEETSPLANTSPLREVLCESKKRKSGRDFTVFLDTLIHRAYRGEAGAQRPEEEPVPGSSPPDSHGSGPLSYGFLNTIEKVQRLLESHRPGSPGLHSPPPPGPPPASPASAAPTTSAQEPLRLTKKTLQEHTRKLEQEHKETWKRKFSGSGAGDLSPVVESKPSRGTLTPQAEPMRTLKRALESSSPPEPGELLTPKHFRGPSDSVRPAPSSTLSPAPASGGVAWAKPPLTEYYRPNPPPPPGRNVQITSLPLGSGASAALSLQALSHQRQLANEAAAKAFLARPAAPQPWPTALLSAPAPARPQPLLHRPQPLHWPPLTHTSFLPTSTGAETLPPPPVHPSAVAQPWMHSHPSSQQPSSSPPQNSAVKEATDALMLLQET